MKMVIGVLLRPGKNDSGKKINVLYDSIKELLFTKGVLPIGICLPHQKDITEEEKQDLYRLISLCDGILLQGGDDFYPYDIETVKYVYEKNIPILGVCLGMQTMSCAFDGIMEDLLTEEHLKRGVDFAHSVTINKDSKLYEIVQQEKILVNSRHKSYIKSTSLSIVGYSQDGIIEAVEDKYKKFFVGVQWHPEDLFTYDTVASRLIDSFLSACTR